jgi:hypothetical protein
MVLRLRPYQGRVGLAFNNCEPQCNRPNQSTRVLVGRTCTLSAPARAMRQTLQRVNAVSIDATRSGSRNGAITRLIIEESGSAMRHRQ